MDVTEFWTLVDKTRENANNDAQEQSNLLTEELAKLSEQEIIEFLQIFYDLKDKAYIGNLWDPAFIIMYYCSDSGFDVFREWLIGRGKVAYENAISNPETLADVLEVGEQVFPTLLGPAFDAYEQVTGKDMPPIPRAPAQLDRGPTGNDREDEILRRFPKLTDRYWEWWTRDAIYLEIRQLLREKLLPLGFMEEEMISLGTVKFYRVPLLVALEFDYYEPNYTLFDSRIAHERKLGST